MSIVDKLKMALVAILLVIVVVGFPTYFSVTPAGRAMWNSWFHEVQKVDDATNYKTKKQVEDTCRSMVSSYNSDKLIYEQYKDSENEEKQSWAEQAKMRANKTAVTYNEYVLKNSYVWEDNIPDDIDTQIEVID